MGAAAAAGEAASRMSQRRQILQRRGRVPISHDLWMLEESQKGHCMLCLPEGSVRKNQDGSNITTHHMGC